ncbi:hypothetical protein LINGRAHAP2_LOCUS23457 [Linum grandiflorum]
MGLFFFQPSRRGRSSKQEIRLVVKRIKEVEAETAEEAAVVLYMAT